MVQGIMGSMKCLTFHVTGRVQGVGFRWSTQEVAQRLGLAGWVRNEDDGSVSGLVQGDEPRIEEFLSWVKSGPAGARVTHLAVEDTEPTGLRVFTIRG
jgi:acylphosphatase